MPARVQQISEDEKRRHLCTSMCRIFDQASGNVANHRKNFVELHKVHTELAQFTESFMKGKRELVKLVGEKDFQDTFKRSLAKIFSLKKGEPTGDRIVKFVGGYIKHLNEKALEEVKQEEDEDDNTTASRFTAHLLRWLSEGFLARDKNVRFRVLQTVAEMIAHLGAIEEDDYSSLRASLIDRLNDKEWIVRYQAVISLAKLCGTEDPSELFAGEQSILSILLETMVYDPSPDVRRAVLVNVPVSEETVPVILERTRDTDTNMRKAVYDSVLAKNVLQGDEKVMGPTHPRALCIQQREMIVKNGLGDREPSVRAVAASLLATWVDVVDIDSESANNDGEVKKIESGVLAFLTLFDLSEGDVAANALSRIFQARVDIFDNIEFNDEYWSRLTPEKAYLARVYVDHCRDSQDNVRLEATLPVVMSIAFRIQEWYNLLQDVEPLLADADDNQRQKKDDEVASKELVLAELLELAVNLDYADEIGRRKMFDLVRKMLRQESLPLKLMAPCLDVMRALSATERDLIRLVVETIQELRDSDDNEAAPENGIDETEPDKSFEGSQRPKQMQKSLDDMVPEEKARFDRINLRCLSLCERMLERVNGTFEDNIMLDGVLKELIVPSVQRKDEIFRGLGVRCLGLCCLIARRLALQTIEVFMNMIASSSPNIRITLVQSLFDIFMVHENVVFKNQDNNLDVLTTFLLQHIEHEQDPAIKALFCKGTSKLVLSGLITDVKVVKNLIKAYISPATVDNQELRQCLAFFLPTYSHSSPVNQKRIREIFIHVFLDVCQDRKETEDELISSSQLAAMFLEWTNPLVLAQAMSSTKNGQGISDAEECIHLDLAENIMKTLFEKDLKVKIEKEDKRVLCQLLNKLHIPDVVDDYKICSLKLLIDHLRTRRPLKDSVCISALGKFEATICKKFEKQLQHFSEEEFRKLEKLNELFEFLDSIISLDDDGDDFVAPEHPRRGRKRRSESMITTTTTGEESHPGSPPDQRRSTRNSKRPRLSSEHDDGTHSSQKASVPPQRVRTRSLPRRAAAGKKPSHPIVISSDSDEDEVSGPSTKRKTSRGRNRPSIKEEQLDKEISALLDKETNSMTNSIASASLQSEMTYDSIMDPDSEEEAFEVSGILGDD